MVSDIKETHKHFDNNREHILKIYYDPFLTHKVKSG